MQNQSDSGPQGSKVGLNLQNFMQLSNIEQIDRRQPLKKHKFEADTKERSQERKNIANQTQTFDKNLNLKNRAQSQKVRELNSTGGARRERSSSVRAGLHSFIRESNIDLDVLSANLSQRKEKQVSRSKSDQSRRTIGSNNKPPGPGLPIPRSLAASKRMAEQYRKGALSRKMKVDNGFTPEHESQKDLPQPVAQPQIMKLQPPQNEQTFENMKKYLQPEENTSDKNNESPSFAIRKTPERQKVSQGRSRSKSGENVTQHDSGVLQQRKNKFRLDADHQTTSERRRRYNSFSQGLGTTPDKDFQQNIIGITEEPNQDLTQAPVGTIVRINRQNIKVNKSIQHYSTFGAILYNKHSNKSQSPTKHQRGRISQPEQAYNSLSREQESFQQIPSGLRPGKIVRQSNNVFNSARNHSKTTNQENTLISRGTEENRLLQQVINMMPTSVFDTEASALQSVDDRASQRNAPQQQHMLVLDGGRYEFQESQPFVPIFFYSEPLYHSIWEAFELPNADLQQLLSSNSLDQHYQEIRDDIENSVEGLKSRTRNISFQQFFSQSQLAIKKIRQGVKIQHKQRLCLMTTELAQMKQTLSERSHLCKATLKLSINAIKINDVAKHHLHILKHDILRDICSRLRQKIVIYALQLKVFQKQEIIILFEEYWQNVYKRICTQFYFNQITKFVSIQKRRREVQAYSIQICSRFKLQRIINTWKQIRPNRLQDEIKLKNIEDLIDQNKVHKIFKQMKISTLGYKLERIENQVLAKYFKYKRCMKLFVKWTQAQRQLNQIKIQALDMLQKPAMGRQKGSLPFTETQIQQKLENCNAWLYDHKFSVLQNQRSVVLTTIKKELSKSQHQNLGFGLAFEQTQCVYNKSASLNLPLQIKKQQHSGDHQVFKSLINNQNPQAYTTDDNQEAMDIKYDIHTLLVDTQNYFQQEQEKQKIRRNLFQVQEVNIEIQEYDNGHNNKQNLLPLQLQKQLSGQQRQGSDSHGASFRAPNQLFAMLEKKVNRLNQNKAAPMNRNLTGTMKHNVVKSEIENMKHQVKKQIEQIRRKIKAVKEEGDHKQHFSFAVKYLIKEEFHMQQTYRLDNETNSNINTYTNTRRSPTRQQNQSQSYIESTPTGDRALLEDPFLQNQQDQQYDQIQPYLENQTYQRQSQGTRASNLTGAHAPTFSVASLTKDKYSMEDYTQFAQNAAQADPDSRKATSMMFTRLHIAKSVSLFYTQWKIAYLQKFLDKSLDQLHDLNLQIAYFSSWKVNQKSQFQKASNYERTNALKKFYRLFENWRLSNGQIVVRQNKMIKKFKLGIVFTRWINFMNIQGDFLVLTLKAQKYHQQALSSKALLSLYTHTLKEAKVSAFQRRIVFLKFFKRVWMPKSEKSRALRLVLKKMNKRDNEWERSRYQREFNYLLRSFEVWKTKVEEKQSLIKEYNALSHYRNSLLIKFFCDWKSTTRVKNGLLLLSDTVLGIGCAPTFQWLKTYTLKTEIMRRDWLSYRQDYLKGQMVMRWRELTVKQKLARMFFMKSVLSRFKNYVHRKTTIIPRQFWMRYRQIMFFKVLKYIVQKKQKRQRKDKLAFNKNHAYQVKLMKKAFIAMLENIYLSKKKFIIKSTVENFRHHQLFEKTFQILKINFLKGKKNKILIKVAKEFRNDRLSQNRAFLKSGSIDIGNEDDKVLLQKIYTSWLQFTLDNFIKSKVVQRYQLYLKQKLTNNVFKAWRSTVPELCSKYRDSPPRNKGILKSQQTRQDNKQVNFEDQIMQGVEITPIAVNQSRARQGAHPNYLEASQGSDLYLESNGKGDPMQYTQDSGNTDQILQSTQKKFKNSSEGAGFVETTAKKRGGSDERSPEDRYPYENTPGPSANNQSSSYFQSKPSQQQRDQTYASNDTQMLNRNQKLFSELEAIFDKNKKWMEEQKDKEQIIKNLADQYQDQILMQDSRYSQSNITKSRICEDNESIQDELASIRRRAHERQMERDSEISYVQTQNQTPYQENRNNLGKSYLQSSFDNSVCSGNNLSPLRSKQEALLKYQHNIESPGNNTLQQYLKKDEDMLNSTGENLQSKMNPPESYHMRPKTQYTIQRNKNDESSFMFGATKNLMSGSGVTSGDADLIYSGQTATQLTYSNTKGRHYIKNQEDLQDISRNTEDEIRSLKRYKGDKSDVSLSSFSNLAKELQKS